jgi:ribonuclease BN (tRNA processing enzyme)
MTVTVTFAGSGDAFGSGGRFQSCIHVRDSRSTSSMLLDCGATSLTALKSLGMSPADVSTVVISHLHGDHFGGLPFLILDGQFSGRTQSLSVVGPPGLAQRLTAAMECLFPGSSTAPRRFDVPVVELEPGVSCDIAGACVQAREVRHPSGAAALALRLRIGGREIGYTGDTVWTNDLIEIAANADLFIAEGYFRRRNVPHHLRIWDLLLHQRELTAKRMIVTHMSADVLEHVGEVNLELAFDGLSVRL